MPKKTPKAPQVGRSKSEFRPLPREVADTGAPHRAARAVEMLTPREGKPSLCYVEAQEALCREFSIAMSTAAADLKKAYAVIRDRLEAMDLGSTIKTEMESLARESRAKGDNHGASLTWFRLGKLAGLGEDNEDSLVKKLGDAALDAAINQAVAAKIEAMSETEFADLQARRAAKAPGTGET